MNEGVPQKTPDDVAFVRDRLSLEDRFFALNQRIQSSHGEYNPVYTSDVRVAQEDEYMSGEIPRVAFPVETNFEGSSANTPLVQRKTHLDRFANPSEETFNLLEEEREEFLSAVEKRDLSYFKRPNRKAIVNAFLDTSKTNEDLRVAREAMDLLEEAVMGGLSTQRRAA